jgi:hypothetical protein
VRYADFSRLHRFEPSGTLAGSRGRVPSRRTTRTSTARRSRSTRSWPPSSP